MNIFDRALAAISPSRALQRERSRQALKALMSYDVAAPSKRNSSLKRTPSDADGAGSGRQLVAYIARDLVRNTPMAVRAKTVISANVIGPGILPKSRAKSAKTRELLLNFIESHLDTTKIDAYGVANLYGLQRQVIESVVESGEVLVRLRLRNIDDPAFPLPFQLQILECDHLDSSRDTTAPKSNGNIIQDGIEYNVLGQRVGYWLFPEHPGSSRGLWKLKHESVFVPAEYIAHIYRVERPGQNRGVSWFAPVASTLRDLADYQGAQLLRQKLAACFVAFRIPGPGGSLEDEETRLSTLTPGRIEILQPGEDMQFANPPQVQGYDEFRVACLREVASGMGITYESLSGDLSRVNFSSARMGRTEMNLNVDSWQDHMIIPMFLDRVGQWFVDAVRSRTGLRTPISLSWVKPQRIIVDPAKEVGAMILRMDAGLASRQGTIRELGDDPERVMEEIIQDRKFERLNDLVFNTSKGTSSGNSQGTQNDADLVK